MDKRPEAERQQRKVMKKKTKIGLMLLSDCNIKKIIAQMLQPKLKYYKLIVKPMLLSK